MTDLFTTLETRRSTINTLLRERARGTRRSHSVVVACLLYLKHSRSSVRRSTYAAHSQPTER